MADTELMAEVEKRTSLALHNEMEMLTFYLSDRQLYGLNVFKIIEILECPKEITRIPGADPTIKGEINFRDHAILLIDLGEYLGLPPTDYKKGISYALVCEYSKSIQGFLITQPNILITKRWDEIIKPEGSLYESSCLTAITYHQGEPVQILDVEKILSEIIGIDTKISDGLLEKGRQIVRREHHILAVDDSKTACHLIEQTLDQLQIQRTVLNDPVAALALLENSVTAEGRSRYTVVLTDIEMPVMDGFTFIRKVRSNPRLADVFVTVHSSLSNKTNQLKAQQMGADDFIPKFTPDTIVEGILRQVAKADARHGISAAPS